MFGGDEDTFNYASLHQLDTKSMTWTLLSLPHDSGPMRKHGCQMIYSNNSLIIIGGYGAPSGELQPGSQFTMNKKSLYGRGWTNETHIYNISRSK